MPKNPNAPLPADTFPLFHTEEPFKALAQRLGVSPNTLRKWWVGEFGQEAFDARGKTIQAKAAAETGRATAGKPRTIAEVTELCSSCSAPVTLNVLQRARSNRILCLGCEGKERGADRTCPVCGLGCVGEKGLSGHMARPQHGDPEAHRAYLEAQAEAEWAGKQEGQDYLRCRLCGHRGVRIDGHLRAEHDLSVEAYRARFNGAEVQADALREARAEQARQAHRESPRKGQTRTVPCSSCGAPRTVGLTFAPTTHETRCPDCVEAERPKATSMVRVSPLKGRTISPETRAKMAANAGRWNAGLTKDTDERVASHAAKMAGRRSWRHGLTKETHTGVRSTSVKMQSVRAIKFWTNGNEVSLSPEQLLPFALKNGKISVGRAIVGLGHAFVTIRRECAKHGLPISHTAVSQAIFLETLAEVLETSSYETEWNDGTFINPRTGGRFRFDGFFPEYRLLCEFQGSQHYDPASVWFFEEGSTYEELVERDREKARQVREDGRFRLFIIREDEPYADPDYLRARLLSENYFDS